MHCIFGNQKCITLQFQKMILKITKTRQIKVELMRAHSQMLRATIKRLSQLAKKMHDPIYLKLLEVLIHSFMKLSPHCTKIHRLFNDFVVIFHLKRNT